MPRVQLRLKVMAGVVVVTLVALAAFDVAAVTTMRRYLLGQTDSSLQGALTLTEPRLDSLLSGIHPGRPRRDSPRRRDGAGAGSSRRRAGCGSAPARR